MSLNLPEVSQCFQHVPLLAVHLAAGTLPAVGLVSCLRTSHCGPQEAWRTRSPAPPSPAAWGAGDGQGRLKGKPWAAEGTQLCCGRLLRLLSLSRAAGGAPGQGRVTQAALRGRTHTRRLPWDSWRLRTCLSAPPPLSPPLGGCSKQGSFFSIPHPRGSLDVPVASAEGREAQGPLGDRKSPPWWAHCVVCAPVSTQRVLCG